MRDSSRTTMHPRQHTLRRAASCVGIGLHTGRRVTATLRPAPSDTGIRFRHSDTGAEIPARWDHVVDTKLCTVLGDKKGARIGTVEHLMAALAGCGIDNALIEVDGEELPAMDGSAAPFVAVIKGAGTVEQTAARRVLRILKPVAVEDGPRRAALLPADGFSLDFEIDFPSRAIGRQALRFAMSPCAFAAEIAAARTFGFLHEVEELRAHGLARGGSLDNAVVIDGDRVMNAGGLRWPDEFVRHKILDAIGDLFLAGGTFLGRFEGVRSSHQLNNSLLRTLFADREAWEWVQADTSRAAGPLAALA